MTTPDHPREIAAYESTVADRDEKIKALTAERDAIKQQAQIWKLEAETHKSTVNECYQAVTGATGEPGNWHGANPVRELVKERDSLKADADRYRWLRNSEWEPFDTEWLESFSHHGGQPESALDAAIDAAMKAAP